MNGVTVENAGVHACAPFTPITIKGELMGCRDGSRGAKARTNEFSTARKAREVVERSASDRYHSIVVEQRPVQLNWHSGTRFAKLYQLR